MDKLGKTRFLDFEESLEFLEFCAKEADFRIDLTPKKHRISGIDQNFETIFDFRLPLPLPALNGDEDLEEYLLSAPITLPSYSLVLIQAGAAAMGYFVDGTPIHHKAIKKYMKRHKRGKSQISYLNTRGKSKAGSRIRLANTVRFFEEINERMAVYEDEYEPERIIYSCTAQVWGLLFQSKVPTPFTKKDPRLIKVPKDVKIPSFEELMSVNEFIKKGALSIFKSDFEWRNNY